MEVTCVRALVRGALPPAARAPRAARGCVRAAAAPRPPPRPRPRPPPGTPTPRAALARSLRIALSTNTDTYLSQIYMVFLQFLYGIRVLFHQTFNNFDERQITFR